MDSMQNALRLPLLLTALLGLAACSGAPSPSGPQPVQKAVPGVRVVAETAEAVRDLASFSRPDEVAVEHLKLDLSVDFSRKILTGRASLRLHHNTNADRLVLDTRDLDVQRVFLDGTTPAKFTLADPQPILGRALEIEITPQTQWVSVDYSTRPEAAALQWLDAAQTAGKAQPFLLSQSEAILARTWVPCQDSPGVRMTYEATLHVPPGLLAVMSATNPQQKSADGVYRFEMPQRIPSYLLAVAVGDLAFRPLGPRAGVYAEPSVVEAAAWELADTPKMIDAAEKLYGPYRWGRYDILVLPPSFPYGGMENPRLTFATPTILARDRSLVSLIAHELAHSWSGNLVTNATWNDFWLNEGFTNYFERRIMESLHGRDASDMLAVIGRQDLDRAIEEAGGPASKDTALYIDLTGRDPDEGTSDIAYEKGALFLRMLEESVGRERFDRFLRAYFDAFAFQSMDSVRFVDYLKKNLLGGDAAEAQKLQIDTWVYSPGIPSNAPAVRSTAFEQVDRQLAALAQGTAAAQLQTQGWTTHQWLHFLRNLPANFDKVRMADLDAAFHFTDTGNSEILDEWLLRSLQTGYDTAYPALERFLTSQGRGKFLRPLYAEMAKTPAGAEMGLRIYEKARPGYHSVSRQIVDKILGWRG
jgi:leukotriene A-4 hydrolase/aminopeptidase